MVPGTEHCFGIHFTTLNIKSGFLQMLWQFLLYLPENITVYDLFSADTIIPCHRYKSEVHMRCMLIIVDYGIDCIFLTKESFQILHGRLKIFFLSLR